LIGGSSVTSKPEEVETAAVRVADRSSDGRDGRKRLTVVQESVGHDLDFDLGPLVVAFDDRANRRDAFVALGDVAVAVSVG
jgi:hypothetical protein